MSASDFTDDINAILDVFNHEMSPDEIPGLVLPSATAEKFAQLAASLGYSELVIENIRNTGRKLDYQPVWEDE